MLANPQTYFTDLPDPRRQTRNKLHKLEDIVMITLCAILCGFEDWVSIEDFGHENEQWLRGFLELRNGMLYRYRAGIPWRDLPARFGDFRGLPGQTAASTSSASACTAGLKTLGTERKTRSAWRDKTGPFSKWR